MAFVNVLSGLSEALAAYGKSIVKRSSKDDEDDNLLTGNTDEKIITTNKRLSNFAKVQKDFFVYQTDVNVGLSKSLESLDQKISFIVSRISAKTVTVGRGDRAQSFRFDPLAPQGKQVTTLTASGKTGRFASAAESNAVLSKMGRADSADVFGPTSLSRTSPTAPATESAQDRFKRLERVSFEESETPLAMFKEETKQNFNKVFGMLEEILENIGDGGGGMRLPGRPFPMGTPVRRPGLRSRVRQFGRFGGGLLGFGAGLGASSLFNEMFRDQEIQDMDTDELIAQSQAGMDNKELLERKRTDEGLAIAEPMAGVAVGYGVYKLTQTKTGKKLTRRIIFGFLRYVKRVAPKLFGRIAMRFAAGAAGLAAPGPGWVWTIVSWGLGLALAYELLYHAYNYWNLSDELKRVYEEDTDGLINDVAEQGLEEAIDPEKQPEVTPENENLAEGRTPANPAGSNPGGVPTASDYSTPSVSGAYSRTGANRFSSAPMESMSPEAIKAAEQNAATAPKSVDTKGGTLINRLGLNVYRGARISSEFGTRTITIDGKTKTHNHTGVDIPAPQGTPFKAYADGVVAFAGYANDTAGNRIELEHGGYRTAYSHLSKMNVKEGDVVTGGQIIGATGGERGSAGAGMSTGPHLHFGMGKTHPKAGLKGSIAFDPQDPLTYIPQTQPDLLALVKEAGASKLAAVAASAVQAMNGAPATPATSGGGASTAQTSVASLAPASSGARVENAGQVAGGESTVVVNNISAPTVSPVTVAGAGGKERSSAPEFDIDRSMDPTLRWSIIQESWRVNA